MVCSEMLSAPQGQGPLTHRGLNGRFEPFLDARAVPIEDCFTLESCHFHRGQNDPNRKRVRPCQMSDLPDEAIEKLSKEVVPDCSKAIEDKQSKQLGVPDR